MYKRNNNRVIKLALITLCLIISVVFMPPVSIEYRFLSAVRE